MMDCKVCVMVVTCALFACSDVKVAASVDNGSPSEDALADGESGSEFDGAPKSCGSDKDCEHLAGPCVKGKCDVSLGVCFAVLAANGSECDDGDPCTEQDWCDAGVCAGTPKLCDDNNFCTSDFCNEEGTCEAVATDASCDDGNPCTTNDECSGGECFGVPLDCNDNDECTADSCDPHAGCVHLPTPGCKSCVKDEDCDDGNPCTTTKCESGKCGQSNNIADGELCVHANPCVTEASCDNGVCKPKAFISCIDLNPCTKGECVEGQCVFTPLTGPACDDKNPCTEKDHCVSGSCVGGSPVNCDDGDLCTVDYCVASNKLCPGELFPSPGAGDYKCCHTPCSQPNPKCSATIGCYCGKGIVCDPLRSDNCFIDMNLNGNCMCGSSNQCKPGSCCIQGACKSCP